MVNDPNKAVNDPIQAVSDYSKTNAGGVEVSHEAPETQTEGTSDRNTGKARVVEELQPKMAAGSAPTGGDLQANQYRAKVSGEEAVGGTTPTPGQNNVDDLAESVGVEIPDKKPLQVKDDLHRRDDKRWELEPKSAEDH